MKSNLPATFVLLAFALILSACGDTDAPKPEEPEPILSQGAQQHLASLEDVVAKTEKVLAETKPLFEKLEQLDAAYSVGLNRPKLRDYLPGIQLEVNRLPVGALKSLHKYAPSRVDWFMNSLKSGAKPPISAAVATLQDVSIASGMRDVRDLMRMYKERQKALDEHRHYVKELKAAKTREEADALKRFHDERMVKLIGAGDHDHNVIYDGSDRQQ